MQKTSQQRGDELNWVPPPMRAQRQILQESRRE